MTATLTTYRIEDHRGIVDYVVDTERAERMSRSGYTVTAITEYAGR